MRINIRNPIDLHRLASRTRAGRAAEHLRSQVDELVDALGSTAQTPPRFAPRNEEGVYTQAARAAMSDEREMPGGWSEHYQLPETFIESVRISGIVAADMDAIDLVNQDLERRLRRRITLETTLRPSQIDDHYSFVQRTVRSVIAFNQQVSARRR